jgi:hypothetical protein
VPSTDILPVGDTAQREAAWTLHARLVRRSLERAVELSTPELLRLAYPAKPAVQSPHRLSHQPN